LLFFKYLPPQKTIFTPLPSVFYPIFVLVKQDKQQVDTKQTLKIMGYIFRITDMVKKVGIVIILVELALLAYLGL